MTTEESALTPEMPVIVLRTLRKSLCAPFANTTSSCFSR
jgi:hypothetical protein